MNTESDRVLGQFPQRRSKKSKEYLCTIDVTGLLSRETCSMLSIEFMKYVMFQREQIPGNFDALISTLLASSGELVSTESLPIGANRTLTPEDENNGSQIVQRNYPVRHADRIKQKSLLTARCLFSQIEDVFVSSAFPIRQLVFVMGSSLITPKETFLLKFPLNTLDGSNVPFETVKKTFFKQLVMTDFLNSFSASSTTSSLHSAYVLILTNRNSDVKWFTPEPKFVLPSKGFVYTIDIINNAVAETSMCSNLSNTSIDISGVDVLENTMELPTPDQQPTKKLRLSTGLDDSCFFDLDDVIWYRAPVKLKGFH